MDSLILAVETSAKPLSVSVWRGVQKLASAEHIPDADAAAAPKHSVVLMPAVDEALARAGISFADIGLFAAANGPGSFTGLRIGISAVKGFAWAAQKPCAGVSTLYAMACDPRHGDGLLCPVMDARRSQVYTALFDIIGGYPVRRAADCAMEVQALLALLAAQNRPVRLAGDGAALVRAAAEHAQHRASIFAEVPDLLQTADGVARAAALLDSANEAATDAVHLGPPEALDIRYLRLPQAERERLAREAQP